MARPLLKRCTPPRRSGLWPGARRDVHLFVVGERQAPAGSGGEAYRIDIEPLGGQILVRVARERPIGTPRASRRLTLANYEEMNVAAGRLAESSVHDRPLGETATSAVHSDSVPNQKKRGEVVVGLGLIGLSVPSIDVYAAPGAEGSLFYETPDLAIGASLAAAGGRGAGRGGGEASYVAFSVGARRYLSRADVTPYLGGGVAYPHIELDSNSSGSSSSDNGGLGAYVEGGVQRLRLHKHHLGAGLRLDAPLYRVDSRYVLPLPFNVTWLMQ